MRIPKPTKAARKRWPKPASDYTSLTPEQAIRKIKKLEQEMFKHARNLEFEEAARLRDEIQKLRKVELGLPGIEGGVGGFALLAGRWSRQSALTAPCLSCGPPLSLPAFFARVAQR